jgi:hypothetical protein
LCGRMYSKSKELKALCEKYPNWLTYVRKHTEALHLRFGIDELKEYIHFHIDFATKEFFGTAGIPKPTKDAPNLDDVIGPFMKKKISLIINTDFSPISAEKIPAIIQVTREISSSKDSVKIQMSGGVLTVEGSKLVTIRWAFNMKGDKARISMAAIEDSKVSDTMLKDCIVFMKSYYDAFIDKGFPNV